MTDTSAMTDTGSEMSTDTGTDEGPGEMELSYYSSQVRYVMRRYYASRAQSCFDRATRNTPTLSGQVVVAMTIGDDGNVSSARATRNSTGDDDLGTCLSRQVESWRFPAPPGGSLQMTIPFSR